MTSHNELTQDINNVFGFERFLNIVANDIREGKYNIKFIKKISETAQTFFEDFNEDDLKELKEKHMAEVETQSVRFSNFVGERTPNMKHHFSPHTFEVSDDEESDGEMEFLPNNKDTTASAFSFDDEEIDRKMKELEALLKKPSEQKPSEQKPSEQKPSEQKPSEEPGSTPPKKEDKVICDFLNNTIDTSKYHYLKGMMTSKLDIDSYCNSCYSY
jgi:hypothetical protein